MKVKLPSGVILEPATEEVAKQFLKYGAEEVVEKKTTAKASTTKTEK